MYKYKVIDKIDEVELTCESDTLDGVIELRSKISERTLESVFSEYPMTFLEYREAFSKLKGDIPPYADFIRFVNDYRKHKRS
jgi:hypothetical protein